MTRKTRNPLPPNPYDWTQLFDRLYVTALDRYAAGVREPAAIFSENEHAEAATIGARAIEFFDFAEDARHLDRGTALLIAAVRRDFFLNVQHGKLSPHRLREAELPLRKDQADGIPWLPRVIRKAEARLRGELPDDLMYGCGGDRKFFEEHRMHPADFLRFVWAANGDEAKIIAYVKAHGE